MHASSTSPVPLMLEAVAYEWVLDDHGRPTRVLRALTPLADGYDPDGRPHYTSVGAHPQFGDGKITNRPGPACTRPREHGLRCQCRTLMRYTGIGSIVRPPDLGGGQYRCAGCTSQGPFSVEWFHPRINTTALIECHRCAMVDRSSEAQRTARGLYFQGLGEAATVPDQTPTGEL